MDVTALRLPGLLLLQPTLFRDVRGFFLESYRETFYREHGMGPFVQDNLSYSLKNTIRGLHFQSTPGQAKLVTCVQGEIWDVAIDLRPDSPTFMEWEAVVLNDQELRQLYIPIGFAHGFCVLSEEARVMYKVSSPYHPDTEQSIRWDDPDLSIAWPTQNPILSARDRISPSFEEMRKFKDVVDYRK